MNLLSNIGGLFGGTVKNFILNVGTQLFDTGTVNGVTGDPTKIGTVFTCCRVLSENLARMPLSVYLDDDNGTTQLKRHRLYYLLRHQPNSFQSPVKFWATIEFHRNRYGNAFARIIKNSVTAYAESLEIIHPQLVTGAHFRGQELIYEIYNSETSQTENVSAWDILHFTGMTENGVFGFSPLKAIERQANINERATSTLDNFYKNNATTGQALETDLPGNVTPSGADLMKTSKADFEKNYSGPENAGKMIHLPIGTRLKSIAMQFADAQLIETLRFSREDISSAHGVPLFMVDGSAEKLDVEQLTTLFQNNTMGPIVAMYLAELNFKLLTRDELQRGITTNFDVFSLIGMAYQTKVNAIKDQVVNGLMTPNEGTNKLGNKPIAGKWGDYHYTQAQYIPLEEREKYDVLVKNDPTLKTVDKKAKDTKNNTDE